MRVVVDEQIQDDDEGYEEGRQQSEDHAAVGIFLEPRQPKAPGVDDDADADAGEVQKRGDERRERDVDIGLVERSEEHTSALQSLMRNSYAGFCLKKNKETSMNS